jgi:hypothetical protein
MLHTHGVVSRALDPEALHRVMSEAAQRLIDALAAEAKLGRRVRRKRPEHRSFRQWRVVQRSIKQGGGDYTKAVRRFRQAIQVLFLKPR